MTPEQKEKLEQVAREWLMNPYKDGKGYQDNVDALVTLLASQRAAKLVEVADEFSKVGWTRMISHEDAARWLRTLAQEQRP